MVIYLFLNAMNECFIFITFSFIKHVVWMSIFYITHLFQAWLIHDEDFLMFLTLPFFKFYKYYLSCEWHWFF